MSEQLSLMQLSNCVLTETSATFHTASSFEQWMDAGRKLCKAGACLNWWLGDWMRFGVSAYGDRTKLATQHADEIGLSHDALTNALYVSERVELSLRSESLSWSHHREVAPLKAKDQKHWLALASESKWSVSQLRQSIRASQAESKERCADNGVNLAAWAQDGLRWFKAHDVTAMGDEQKRAVKDALKPIVELYQKL